ncbi:SDR family oxidoreductase [Pseudarthrobacter defluvii]|uniref:SDR family oxidoreductase n=1 Tax=Pseudarthrobacter defluvii TaxID=410837 RepID=UPI0025777D53|nr:SDR family oxidoreductase [Pseudarthrobacter defluvii]WJH25474.1 SDR family oxidoreductase [Pseudarthrobacter defluvii]
MPRTSVVTGAASGIGKATKELLEQRGERVIGVDLHDAEVVADLASAEGRAALVDAVRKVSGGRIDAIYANAGLASAAPPTVAVNFFGAIATLEKLRPLLRESEAPRAVVVSSMAALMASDEELVGRLTAGDEQAAMARAEVLAKEPTTGGLIYCSTKLALSRWVRRQAATADWAGAGIPLNAVAPGIIATPMTAEMIDTEQERESLLKVVPMPLNGIAEPVVVARLLAWLNSAENTHLCGQIVYVDGGSDVVLRGDSVW